MLFDATVCDSPVQDPAVAKADVALLSYPPPPTNQPPVLTVDNSSVSGNEGSYATNSGTVSDPNFDFVTLSASLGSVSNNSGNWTWSYMAPDGHVPPVTQTVTITADDGRGGTAQASFSLIVNNVAPTLTLSGPAEVRTGVAFQVGRSVSDPGQDTIASWNVNWGDGTPVETFPGNPLSFSHVYAAPGTFSVSATATDEDGTFSSNTLQVLAKTDRTINPADDKALGASSLNRLPVSLAAGTGQYTAVAVRHADGTVATANLACTVVNAVGGAAAAGVTASPGTQLAGGNYPINITVGAGAVVNNDYNIKVYIVDEPAKFMWVYITVIA